MSKDKIKKLESEVERLRREIEDEREKYSELEIMHNSILEHNTYIENELDQLNRKILSKMKKYLSPQLYNIITGEVGDLTLSYKRKKLTIFFSDIADFTTITEAVEPEIISDCLNKYLDEMSKICMKYGGTIDKFIGDAIMIFFGDPDFEADEIHAEKCVKMALEMRNRLPDVNRYWKKSGIPSSLRMRMGVNTGYCTVGNFGTEERMDYTIIGAEVNIASRLEGMARHNSIYISESTKVLVEEIIDAKPIGQVNVKGVHFPINVYEAVDLKEPQSEELNPYIEMNEEGFKLSNVTYSYKQSNLEERNLMIAALRKALFDLNADPE